MVFEPSFQGLFSRATSNRLLHFSPLSDQCEKEFYGLELVKWNPEIMKKAFSSLGTNLVRILGIRKHQRLSFRHSQKNLQVACVIEDTIGTTCSWENMCAWLWNSSPFWPTGSTFIVDRLFGGLAWHAHVFIPLWSVLYAKAFVEWFTILFYSHSAGYEMVIWSFYLSEKSRFYLLIVMAVMQQRGNLEKPYDFFLSSHTLFGNWTGTSKSEVYSFIFALTCTWDILFFR